MDAILKEYSDIYLEKRLPSYIENFLPELPKNAMFIHRSSSKQRLEGNLQNATVINGDSSLNLDVTGSPLNFSKYSLWQEDSVVNLKKCWSEEEEKHLPVSFKNARIIISRYLTKVQNCNIPLWIAGDGLDTSKTLLLGGFKEGGWCWRSLGHYLGLMPLSLVEDEVAEIATLALGNKQVIINVQCTFNLCEENGFEKTLEITQSEFIPQSCSKMLIQLQWHHASLKVPQDGVSAIIAMDFKIGNTSSAITSLWSQLNILSRYIESLNNLIIDKQPRMVSSKNSVDKVLLQDMSRKILALINNHDNTFESLSRAQRNDSLTHEKSKEDILVILTNHVVECTRPYCDVTDKIWLLLNELDDVRYIAACLNNTFSELGDCKSKPHINPFKNTLLSNIIAANLKEDFIITEVSDEKTLEIMIDTGIEKLKQDYIYIFTELGLECTNYFKDHSGSIAKSFNIVKHNLNVLTQMHVALDFIFRVSYRFDLRDKDLNSVAENALTKSCQLISSDMVQNNPQISLEIPVNFPNIFEQLPINFSKWKLTMSSKVDQGYTVLLVSSQPLFPPSIQPFDSENQTPEEEPDCFSTFVERQYHAYKLFSLCDRV